MAVASITVPTEGLERTQLTRNVAPESSHQGAPQARSVPKRRSNSEHPTHLGLDRELDRARTDVDVRPQPKPQPGPEDAPLGVVPIHHDVTLEDTSITQTAKTVLDQRGAPSPRIGHARTPRRVRNQYVPA